MDYAIKDMLKQSITVETFKSRDKYNKITYNEPTTRKALIVTNINVKIGEKGKEKTASTEITLDPDDGDFSSKDRITLPNGDTPEILKVVENPDPQTGDTYSIIVYT